MNRIRPQTKYGVGIWITNVIRSCTNLEQLEAAERLLYLFEISNRYYPPWELTRELYGVYRSQWKLLTDETYHC
tara:strand:- start:3885 stop:4106 length:222 start_codon:yes stop_codon:yes gene_type:complete